MIAQLTGVVTKRDLEFALINVHGVGYKVYASSDTLSGLKEGKEVTLWTYLAVRETALDLYGFETQEALSFFELLIGVSGIGPKSAIGVLDVAPVESLRGAVAEGDTTYLTKVSGIGKKTAQKIVLELKDKIGNIKDTDQNEHRKEEADVLDALKALGYSTSEAREALKQVSSDTKEMGKRIKEALKFLGS